MIAGRWLAYAAALLGAGALALFGHSTPVPSRAYEVVSTTAKAARTAPAAGLATATRRDDRDPRVSGGPAWVPLRPRETLWQSPQARAAVRDIFSAHSWMPAPKPVAATLPPSPQAPPVPFTFLGKRHDGSGWDVFLGRGDHTFIVREGATIESSYRIDAIAPPTLTLTYLPLARSQTLSIGGAD